jgi:hypothetical protein
MAYTGATLITEIKTRAKDTSLSDSFVLGYIQETQDTVLGSHRYPQLDTTYEDNVMVGDRTYVLPDDLQVISSIKFNHLTEIFMPEYVLPEDFERMFLNQASYSTGAPTHYTLFEDEVVFNTILDKSYSLVLKYTRTPTLITTTSTPDIPEEYKWILINGALAGIEEYRQNFDIAGIYRRKVEDMAESFRLRYLTRQTSTPHKVRSTRRRI